MEKIGFEKYHRREPKKSAVAEIVNAFCEKQGIAHLFKVSPAIRQRFPYGRMAGRAKQLLELCGGKLEDALYMVNVRNWWL